MKSVLDNGSQAVRELADRIAAQSDLLNELQLRNRNMEDRVRDRESLHAELIRQQEQTQRFADHIEDLTRAGAPTAQGARRGDSHGGGSCRNC